MIMKGFWNSAYISTTVHLCIMGIYSCTHRFCHVGTCTYMYLLCREEKCRINPKMICILLPVSSKFVLCARLWQFFMRHLHALIKKRSIVLKVCKGDIYMQVYFSYILLWNWGPGDTQWNHQQYFHINQNFDISSSP